MKKLLLLCMACSLMLVAWAQERTITGRATSAEDGTGLPGVNIVLKGTATGTVTDADGKYSLGVPAEGGTLVFSFIGLVGQEIPIGSSSVLNVQMSSDVRQLSEIVVTALGEQRKEQSLGYSASTVASQSITQGRSFSPINSLQGKVAGLVVNSSSGQPGASTFVNIRGINSLSGNNNPLYVVDGVPVDNSFNNISSQAANTDPTQDVNRQQDYGNRMNDFNPDDIESISILKSASATALYGSRAANGVILITTKKGRLNEKLRVNVTSSATFSEPLRIPQVQQRYGQGWNGIDDLTQNGSWGPSFDSKDRVWGNVVDNSQQLKPYVALPSNVKDFYETGKSFMNTLSLSGGSDKLTYYFSYGNTSEDGVVPTNADSYKRNSFGLRGTYTDNKLTISSSINYFLKNAKVVTVGQGDNGATLWQEMIQVPNDISVVDLKNYNNPFNNLDNYYTPYSQNPYFVLNENGNDYVENRVEGNVDLGYNLTDWLSVKFRAGTDVANANVKDWVAIANFSDDGPNGSTIDVPGTVWEHARYSRQLNTDLILNFNKSLGSDFNLNVFLGHNLNERSEDDYDAHASNLNVPGFYNLKNSNDPPTVSTFQSDRRLIGAYAQAELSYKDYLYLNLSARNDWSSTLPEGKNSYFYSGANMSFVFTQLTPGLQNILSFGKLRAAFGQTGRDAPPYGVYNVFTPSSIYLPFGTLDFPLQGVNAYEVSNTLGNPNLKPEITQEAEVGTELKFFQNRIGIDLSLYKKETKDQILPVQLANSTGYSTQISNFGKIENKGIEALFTITPIRNANVTWTLSSNWTINRNKVIELADGLDEYTLNSIYSIDFVAIKGKPVGVFKSPDYARDPEGHVVVNAVGIPTASTDKSIVGNIEPDFITGLTNDLSYKNFNLSFTFDYRQGGLMYSYTQHLMEFVGNSTTTLYNDRKPFIVPNSVKQLSIDDDGNPVYAENNIPVNMTYLSDYFNSASNPVIERTHLLDRTYLKLREVALTYNLPPAILNNTFLDNLSISVVGRNLLLWTPTSNNVVDPEITAFTGASVTAYTGEFAVGPTVRSIGFSLKAGIK